MVADSVESLRVRVVGEDPAGAPFLSDLCKMLEAVAHRRGSKLHFEVLSPIESRADLPSASRRVVESEIGLHRAQLVKPDSQTGRITTIKVAVDVPDAGRTVEADAAPIRTYNFPMGRCTVHASGVVLPLDEVLSGRAG